MRACTLYVVALCTVVALTALNAMVTFLMAPVDSKRADREYTYVGDDFPELWPLPPTPPVLLAVENSAHYPIIGLDAREEWAANTPKGFGFMRLGPEGRAFAISMYHQLHCLRLMRYALASGDRSDLKFTHFGHCLIYLRQLILCNPDLTLEPYDVLEGDYDVKQDGSTHVCQDWRQVYDAMASNWDSWSHSHPTAVSSNVTNATGSCN
ncbi:hypothetical protein VTO73DRAFT_9374 [Trametes versicolor]